MMPYDGEVEYIEGSSPVESRNFIPIKYYQTNQTKDLIP